MRSSDAMNAWRRGLLDDALARVDEHDRRSAVEAPVTMLRVYWMCPGVSAMMNLRRGVAK